MYIINYCLKLCLLTPLILSTLTLAVLNDLPMAEPPLSIDVMAPFINIIAPFIDVTAPLPINTLNNLSITKPPSPINALNTQLIETKVTTINYGRDLATLAKIYTEESKYSGENNNFNYKLTIFNNLCDKVSIPQEVKIKGFLIMLHSITLNFYYKNKATYTTFNSICNAIRNHFKGLKYKYKILIKWNTITFKTVIIKNKSKSTGDCL